MEETMTRKMTIGALTLDLWQNILLCVVLHTQCGSQMTLWSCYTWCVAGLLPSPRAHLFISGVSSIQTSRIWLTKLIFSHFLQWLHLFSSWKSWGDVGVRDHLSGLSLSQSSERSYEFWFNGLESTWFLAAVSKFCCGWKYLEYFMKPVWSPDPHVVLTT